MPDTAITVEHLSKHYRLGLIGASTLRESVEHWWHRMRGRDPRMHMGRIDPSRRSDPEQKTDDAETDLWALNDVSFTVAEGEVLGVIGKNGAGKSTLLKILTRITEPTTGRAVINGRMASLLEVGTGFHPELTGRENIFLNGAILGMKKAEIARKFDEIVAFSEIGRFIDTPVKRYSSGMYVRLAFAVAAHLDPEILLVDEVLAVGDKDFQKKCLGKMKDVAGQGRTVLFVSHNMPSILNLCDRCLLLKQGGVEMIGKAEPVVRQYLDGERAAKDWDIAARRDRRGTGSVKLKGMRISRNYDDADVEEVFLHDDVTLHFTLHAEEEAQIWAYVSIADEYGKVISLFSLRPEGFALNVHCGDNGFSLHLPRIPLLEGTYYFTVALHNIAPIILFDLLENARRLIILPQDVHGVGYPMTSLYGVTYFPHEWRADGAKGEAQLIKMIR